MHVCLFCTCYMRPPMCLCVCGACVPVLHMIHRMYGSCARHVCTHDTWFLHIKAMYVLSGIQGTMHRIKARCIECLEAHTYMHRHILPKSPMIGGSFAERDHIHDTWFLHIKCAHTWWVCLLCTSCVPLLPYMTCVWYDIHKGTSVHDMCLVWHT